MSTPGTISVSPYLAVENAEVAITWYKKGFQATAETLPLKMPGGGIAHAEIRIGDALVMLSDANPDFGTKSPAELGGTPVRLALEVPDTDSFMARAEQEGAKVLIPAGDQFYGMRAGRLEDPFGHVWVISTVLEKLTPSEMQARLDAMFAES